MKQKYFILFIVLISFLFSGCMMLAMRGDRKMGMIEKNSHASHENNGLEKHRAHYDKEIREVLTEQVRNWNEGSIEGYMNTYEKSDSILFASGGNITFGWQTLFERFQKKYPNKEAMGVLTFSDLRVEVVSENFAVAFGRWNIARNENPPNGLFTLYVKKINGNWKVVHDHSSVAE